jgi:hypothetical protein
MFTLEMLRQHFTANTIFIFISVAPLSASELYRLTTATCRLNLVSSFVDRGVSRGQRGGSPTVVNLAANIIYILFILWIYEHGFW